MTFEILSAEKDLARWTALVDALPPEYRDIHFLPEYVRVYRDSYGFGAHLAVYAADEGFVIQPFVRRPLRELAFLAHAADGENFSDLANPYGFGGPVSNAADPEVARRLYRAFAGEFAEWCDREGIASEFASLHPFFVTNQLSLIQGVLAARQEKDVVYIDLTGDESKIAKGMRKGHRSSVALARKGGARLEKVETSETNLAVFGELYAGTMVRRQAAERWFVPENYFSSLARNLGAQRTSLFFAKVGDETESACLLMHDFATAYYHFAATRAARPELGVNNFMVLETAIWAKAAGFARYHLGGGVTRDQDDSLLRFKAGFSDRRAPLYIYFCVRDRAVYDELCARKKAYERETTGAESFSDFLPLYRR
jgi:hypothetical protein